MFVPFFLGALALGLIFVRYVDRIGSVYCANLLGSGVGGLAAIVVLWWLPAVQGTAIIAMVPILAGFLLVGSEHRALLVTIGSMCLAFALYFLAFPSRLILSEYKGLSRTMNLPDAVVVLERSSPYGLVQVVSAAALRYAPGLSLTYRQPVSASEVVFNNGDWFGPVVRCSRTDTIHMLDYTTLALPYMMRSRERVLVLQSRTGLHVAHALARRARQVVGVESHRTVVSILQNEIASASDSLFYRPGVQISTLDPRTYLMQDTSRYDLIVLPILDAFGGTSGLYALQEQYLLTKEAIFEVFDHLADGGVLCITSWIDHPVRNPLRALATIVQALRDAGIEQPARHVAAVRSWGTITFVAGRTPLKPAEVDTIRSFCGRMLFDPLLLPDLRPSERARYNQTSDSSFFGNLDEVLHSEQARVYREYGFNIFPATDDRPYFSQFLRWNNLPRLRELFGDRTFPFLELGSLIVAVTFLQILAIALVLIIVPLFGVARQWERKVRTIVYFGAVGVGYMCIEMVLIQRFVLYFGQTLFAASAVIAALLISSGFGSIFSARLPSTATVLQKTVGLVAVIILFYAIALMPVLHASVALQTAGKVLLSFVVIAPLGFLMGMPFPVGLRTLSRVSEPQIAWAWGINGCATVVSTALATMIAVYAGFFAVMLSAAAMYMSAMVASASRK
jgi:spermidine synthase